MLTRTQAAAGIRDPAAAPRLLITILAIMLLWPGLHLSELNLAALWPAGDNRAMRQFLAGFWPPEHGWEFGLLLWRATLQTLAIATAGLFLALLIALPCGVLASHVLSLPTLGSGKPALLMRWCVRLVLIVLRSVPEIVWALLFVRAAGLGPTAGVLAIAITYSGMLGKVYAEIFESIDATPAHALLSAGSGRTAAFLYGVVPNAAPEMVSYTVYRWECAIRASVVMGFVGAGGLGQQIELSLRMFAGGEVASLLLVFISLVVLADQLSRLLRARLG